MKPLSTPSRRLVEAARPAESPSAGDRDRVRARVMAAILAGSGVAASASIAGAAAKPLAAAGLGAAPAAAAAGTPGLVKAIVLGALLGLGTVSAAELVLGRSAPQPPDAPRASPVTSAPRPLPSPLPRAVPATREAPSTEPLPPRAGPRPAAPAAPAASLREELAILKEAQRAIHAGETDRAMELLDAHAQRFQGGSLREERLAARAIALCEARRTAEAKRAAAQFFAEAGVSPLEARVRAACKDALSGGSGD